MRKTRLTSKGQVTIPQEVRRRLGLRPGDEIEFVEDRDGFRVRKCVGENPFTPFKGTLTEWAGHDPDELLEELRGR